MALRATSCSSSISRRVALRDGNIAGLDAQLYWRHPQKGVLPAAEFISASEDASERYALAQWLIRSACIQLRAWCAAGLTTLYLCIDVFHPALRSAGICRVSFEKHWRMPVSIPVCS